MPFPATLTIQRDAPVGTVLGSAQTVTQVNCNSTQSDSRLDGSWYVFPAASNKDYGPSSLANVRATNFPGVGIRWANNNSYTGTTQYFSAYSLASGNTSTNRRGIAVSGATTFTDTFEFVKTGPITSGTYSASSYAMQYSTPVSSNVVNAPLKSYSIPQLYIQVIGCSVSPSDVTIPLPPVSTLQFAGKGSTAGSKDFNISLTCDTGASINATINGTVDANAGNPSVLASTGTAQGAGVQLLSGGAPYAINTGVIKQIADSTTALLPLTARYYQTLAKVTPGTVAATATMTMTYK